MGFALDAPGDEVEVSFTDRSGITISKITGDKGKLPTDPKANTAGVAVKAMLGHIQFDGGIDIVLEKKMPLGSGLGSSAASAVAAVTAVNAILENPLNNQELLPFILASEKAVCGIAHADNASPSLFGGFILVRSYTPLDVVSLTYPKDICCTIVHPDLTINTRAARELLKSDLHLTDAVAQWGNVAGLVSGLANSDYELISRSLVDVVAEPVRSSLIPGFESVKQSALDAGALGCGISGSGPAMFALCNDKDITKPVGEAMQQEFQKLDIKSNIYISAINSTGARLT